MEGKITDFWRNALCQRIFCMTREKISLHHGNSASDTVSPANSNLKSLNVPRVSQNLLTPAPQRAARYWYIPAWHQTNEYMLTKIVPCIQKPNMLKAIITRKHYYQHSAPPCAPISLHTVQDLLLFFVARLNTCLKLEAYWYFWQKTLTVGKKFKSLRMGLWYNPNCFICKVFV